MKDIVLKKTDSGYYDWTFNDNDLDIATGNKQIRNGIIHEILLKYGELEQEIYSDNGCKIDNYINAPNTARIQEMIQNILIDSIKKVDGVRDAQVKYEKTDMGIKITEIDITRTDGGMFTIAI